MKKVKPMTRNEAEKRKLKDFFDMVFPGAIRFFPHHYIIGDSYRCVWALREYPPVTSDQALLSHYGDKKGVTLRIYSRIVEPMEQDKLINQATRVNRLMSGGTNIQDIVTAEGNLADVTAMLMDQRHNSEPLLHCCCYIELIASSLENLEALQSEIGLALSRDKLTADRLTLRQKEGFLCVSPVGYNVFGAEFERILPASSVANFYPFNYSGKTDPHGFYIGRDKYGSNILVDFDRRTEDKTNGNILILGNSGQGKSYLLKLLLTNLFESGKQIVCLDAEQEYVELTENLGGCYLDMMSGQYIINPLEPKLWSNDPGADDENSPEAFRKSTILSQHIAYLKDFFRAYKDFSDAHIDAIEILLTELYKQFGIDDQTDFRKITSKDFPIVSDLYNLVEKEYQSFCTGSKSLFTEELLREICLGLHSMCKGAERKFFDGHTNITSHKWVCFGVRGLMDSNKRLKDTMLFNILSYMNHRLLMDGNTVASIDELYLFLTNLTTIEYIRNAEKRVRKKDSSIILASQNVEDFLIDGIREYTKPLFSIPTHQFLFNAGTIDAKDFMDALQITENEFELIKLPARGMCLFKCGNERYLLEVKAPAYKSTLFGEAGGR